MPSVHKDVIHTDVSGQGFLEKQRETKKTGFSGGVTDILRRKEGENLILRNAPVLNREKKMLQTR